MAIDTATFQNKIKLRKSFDSRNEIAGIPSMPFACACVIGAAAFFLINVFYGLFLAAVLNGVLYVLYQVDPDFLSIARDKILSDSKSLYLAEDEYTYSINYL